MSEDRFTNKYRIPSARASWHSYDGGIYFATICTAQREHFFGEIRDNQMVLSHIGQYANDQITNISTHYPYAEIPSFVIMPNHIHAIVLINGENVPCNRGCRDVARRVSTMGQTNDKMLKIANMQGWLSVVIGGLKSSITKYAHEHAIPFQWQSRFHDHIVRKQDELNQIALYIEQNVAKWNEDELY